MPIRNCSSAGFGGNRRYQARKRGIVKLKYIQQEQTFPDPGMTTGHLKTIVFPCSSSCPVTSSHIPLLLERSSSELLLVAQFATLRPEAPVVVYILHAGSFILANLQILNRRQSSRRRNTTHGGIVVVREARKVREVGGVYSSHRGRL